MSAQALFYVTYAPFVAAAVLGIIFDAMDSKRITLPVVAFLLAAGGAAALVVGWNTAPTPVYGTFVVGRVFSAVAGVIGLLGAVTVAGGIGGSALPRTRQNAALVALAVIGAGLAASTTDLTALLLALETSAVCAYALVASERTARSGEAAMKYFIQGAVATGLAVAGVAILAGAYAPSGSYFEIAHGLEGVKDISPALAGCILLITALAFKAGAAPFHSWAPDAYETAPPAAAAFLAGAAKVSAVAALAWFASQVGPVGASKAEPLGMLGGSLLPIIGALAVLSVVIGSLVALRQKSYTRMLGYAGVAQVGYALIAVAALNPPAAIIAAVTYAIAATGSFLAAEAFRSARPEWDGTIDGLAGLGTRHPVLGAAVALIMMSLAGIPPLLGFWGKFQAFGTAVASALGFAQAGNAALTVFYSVLAAVGIAGSVVSLGYYGRVMRALYFGGDDAATGEGGRVGAAGAAAVVVAIILLAVGLLPLVLGIPSTVWGFLLQ